MQATDRSLVAQLQTAAFQDVDAAEAAGYVSSLDTLGCFQDPARGGMGVHYIDESLLDANGGHRPARSPRLRARRQRRDRRPRRPRVHRPRRGLDRDGAHRTSWASTSTRHATLPLWVLHTWIWKYNAAGVFADWNPGVRQCPAGVPASFGIDLPA